MKDGLVKSNVVKHVASLPTHEFPTSASVKRSLLRRLRPSSSRENRYHQATVKPRSTLRRKKYTHVDNVTKYMAMVVDIVDSCGKGLQILDIPAGNGYVVNELRRRGHNAVGADINGACEHFVRANMEDSLPFDDASFDAITCLEGIEHVVDEVGLLREFFRVLRPDGTIVISTPNVMNLYSRFHYFIRGYPYQFLPGRCRLLTNGEVIDRGHINPLSYIRLRYILESFGAEIVDVTGDRAKKKILLPLLLPIAWMGRLFFRGDFDGDPSEKARMHDIKKDLGSRALMQARSLILVARKVGAATKSEHSAHQLDSNHSSALQQDCATRCETVRQSG